MLLRHQPASTSAHVFHRAAHGHALLDKLELSERLVLSRLFWPNAAILLLQVIEADADVEGLVCFNHSLRLFDCFVARVRYHRQDHYLLIDFLGRVVEVREVFFSLLLMILMQLRYLHIGLHFLGLDASMADFSLSAGVEALLSQSFRKLIY